MTHNKEEKVPFVMDGEEPEESTFLFWYLSYI
jgi:hypothetical protein